MKILKMFKEWYQLAKPNTKYWVLQFISVTIPSVCLLFESYFAAHVTTRLVAGDFKMAIIFSVIILMIVAVRALSWDFNYRNTSRLVESSYFRIQDKLFNKIIKASDTNFEKNSSEKITNIMHNDVYDTAIFADSLCSRFRYFISILLCVGYILFYNALVALLVFFGLIILYVIITKINESIAKSKIEQRKAVDNEYQAFNQVIKAKNVAKEYNIVNDLKKEVRNANQSFFNARRLHYKAYSRLDNDYVILYKALIFITTIVVMFLLRNDFISLTIYLTIISYVTEGLTYSSSCYSILTDFKNSYVSASRVKIILDFDDRKTLELGEINKSDLLGEIDFVRVNYKSLIDEFKITDLKDVSFHISTKQSVVFKGHRGCGKRTIFYMLRRMIKPDSGSCYLDKIKITDYSEKGYEGNINFIQTRPYFYNDTIIKNLKMVHKSERKIIEACKELEIYDYIMSLPNKFNTNINTLSQRDLYLIGLVRMLLFDSEVLLVYEFPNYLSDKDIKTVKRVFNQLSMSKTIIYFSATDLCDDLVDKVYEVENGEVKMVKVNTHRKVKTLFDITK